MTGKAIFLRIIRKIPALTSLAQSIVRKKAANSDKRKKLNNWYNSLDLDGQAVFQNLFCKIFRDRDSKVSPGYWQVHFRGKELRMPLRNEQLWLDWDNALSVTAHDPDVKETYQNLLDSMPVNLFFDIGANYGTHSLLFLSQGVRTVSFEPNSTLNNNFESLCQLNNIEGTMENYAIGDRQGVVQLHFPVDATWLGTIVESEASVLKTAHQLTSIDVPLVTLDQYVTEKGIEPDLIKIDTEGNEINVLKGAKDLLIRKKPLVIFESNTRKERQAIWGFLAEVDYIICDLPFGKGEKKPFTAASAFISSPKFNFIAIPKVA